MIMKMGDLKNADTELKIVSLKCLWICRLYEFHHNWKTNPLNSIKNALSKCFKFHSKLSILNKIIKSLPSYYKDIDSWFKYYSWPPKVLSSVSLQFLWYNSFIEIDSEVVCYKDFADKKN